MLYISFFFQEKNINNKTKFEIDLMDLVLKISKNFTVLLLYIPLKKGLTLHKKNLNLLHRHCFVSTLVKIDLVVLEKMLKMYIVYRQMDTDKETARQIKID